MTKSNALNLKGLYKTIGPGILYAGAAIGASHLVLSTRAGAMYSFKLIWIILLINLFKYPFFEFSYRYTAATGKSVLDGYKKLGNWAIITFLILSFFTAIVNFAAVVKITSDLAAYLFNLNTESFITSIGLLAIILLMLFIGRYALLDKTMKAMIFILGILTVVAFFYALKTGAQAQAGYTAPPLWDAAGITFLIALMGWMPTPIDASVWSSLWAIERQKQTKYIPSFKEYRVDFHIGYFGSAFLAIFFLGLGALVMYGTGIEFSNSGYIFSKQLVELYSGSIGSWSTKIIAVVVLITMLSTALTVIDGYPRSLEGSFLQIFPSLKKFGSKLYFFWVIFLSITASIIIAFFTKNMVALLVFATILSFETAPVFAFINYKVVCSGFIPKESQPPKWLKILSWAGICFLIGFIIIYIYYSFLT
ncbi:MAG: Nramp family divalent metal transporter [Bacteroidetes bacterium]|nr:Nramp family divalent metal transporter [Bacteroidota bacterium]